MDDAVLFYFYKKIYNKCNGMYPDSRFFKDLEKQKFLIFFDWIKKSKFTNLNYSEIFDEYANKKNCFIFLDPPYLDSFNNNYNNGNKNDINNYIIDKTNIFIDIIVLLKKSKCEIMLIINKNAITNFLYKKYIKDEYNKLYQCTKNKTIHYIISNIKSQ
jgi:hypothetical protein